jgi:isoquinoline 1-oxidoreductase beta subunit
MKAGLERKDAAVGNQVGDARAALAAAPRKIEAVYSYPHQNTRRWKSMNATARWTPERCEVWTPTQNGEAALAAASEAAELPLAKCDVHKLAPGRRFGRRGRVHDWVRQVVAIAKEMPGTPVKLIWSREEDMLHGCYHPVTQCKLTAGSMPRATSPRCTCGSPASRSCAGCFRRTSRTARTRSSSRA